MSPVAPLGLHSTAGPFGRTISILDSDFGRQLDSFIWPNPSNEGKDFRTLFELDGCDDLYNGFETPACAAPSLVKESAARIQRWASYPDKVPKPKSIRRQASTAPRRRPAPTNFELPSLRDAVSNALDQHMSGAISLEEYGNIKHQWWSANRPVVNSYPWGRTLKRTRNQYESDTDDQLPAKSQRPNLPSTAAQPASQPAPPRFRGLWLNESAPYPQPAEQDRFPFQPFSGAGASTPNYAPADQGGKWHPYYTQHSSSKPIASTQPRHQRGKVGPPLSYGKDDGYEEPAVKTPVDDREPGHEACGGTGEESDGDAPPSTKRARQSKAQPKAAKSKATKPETEKAAGPGDEKAKKKGAWSDKEYLTLYETLKSFQEQEHAAKVEHRLKDTKLFKEMEKRIARHPTRPVHRTHGACKNFWLRYGRVRDFWDEMQGKYNPNVKCTSVQKPKSKGGSSKQKKSVQIEEEEEYGEDEEDEDDE